MTSGWIVVGALAACVAVALGAFGAHWLRSRLGADQLAVFETAMRYQMYHAIALLAVGAAATRWTTGFVPLAGWLFLLGILIFSGSLYVYSTTGARWLAAITPIGGLCFILGWLAFAIAALLPQAV